MRGCALVSLKEKGVSPQVVNEWFLEMMWKRNSLIKWTREKNDYWTRLSALVNNFVDHDIFLNLVRKLQTWDPIFDPS